MKPNTTFFDRLPRLTRWQEFRVTLTVRWVLYKLVLCRADPFLALNEVGDEFLYAGRPWLAKLLFRGIPVLHPSQPIPPATPCSSPAPQ